MLPHEIAAAEEKPALRGTPPERAAMSEDERTKSDTCACFPGTCLGGEIIDGNNVAGLRCKAAIPAGTAYRRLYGAFGKVVAVAPGSMPDTRTEHTFDPKTCTLLPAKRKHSHYFKPCPFAYVDVYRVLELFKVTDQALGHAIKKLLVAGGRGAGKDIRQDVQEAIDTLTRWQEMRVEDNGPYQGTTK
jgi:hypothetical protein